MMIRREKKKTEGQKLSDVLIRLYFRYFDRSLSSQWITTVFGEHVGRQSAVREISHVSPPSYQESNGETRLREHDTLRSELSAVACWRRGTCNEKEYNMSNIEGTGVRVTWGP